MREASSSNGAESSSRRAPTPERRGRAAKAAEKDEGEGAAEGRAAAAEKAEATDLPYPSSLAVPRRGDAVIVRRCTSNNTLMFNAAGVANMRKGGSKWLRVSGGGEDSRYPPRISCSSNQRERSCRRLRPLVNGLSL